MNSACLITWNEEELLPNCLKWLESLSNLHEICIIDSFSTDKTWDIIQSFCQSTNKKCHIRQRKFDDFATQKNECIRLAQGDWILIIDADETYGWKMNNLLGELNQINFQSINAIRLETMNTFLDYDHYILTNSRDPHTRLFRKGFATYKNKCHERLFDQYDRDLHECKDKDIYDLSRCPIYHSIRLLHHQSLKTRNSLLEKGTRWAEVKMISESGKQGHKVDQLSWVDKQDKLKRHEAIRIPKDMRQYKIY